jgi:hypothetical protein
LREKFPRRRHGFLTYVERYLSVNYESDNKLTNKKASDLQLGFQWSKKGSQGIQRNDAMAELIENTKFQRRATPIYQGSAGLVEKPLKYCGALNVQAIVVDFYPFSPNMTHT